MLLKENHFLFISFEGQILVKLANYFLNLCIFLLKVYYFLFEFRDLGYHLRVKVLHITVLRETLKIAPNFLAIIYRQKCRYLIIDLIKLYVDVFDFGIKVLVALLQFLNLRSGEFTD